MTATATNFAVAGNRFVTNSGVTSQPCSRRVAVAGCKWALTELRVCLHQASAHMFFLFLLELCGKHHQSVVSALTLMLGVHGPLTGEVTLAIMPQDLLNEILWDPKLNNTAKT